MLGGNKCGSLPSQVDFALAWHGMRLARSLTHSLPADRDVPTSFWSHLVFGKPAQVPSHPNWTELSAGLKCQLPRTEFLLTTPDHSIPEGEVLIQKVKKVKPRT